MNVIVSNKNQSLLNTLDVDIIKSINGEFTSNQIIETFSNFFFNKMFLDITAIKDYTNISNIQKLSMSIDMDKVILLVDANTMNNNEYLSKLISIGIYNFASNKDELMYLYNHPNAYKDVAHIHKLGTDGNQTHKSNKNIPSGPKLVRTSKVIGFKNATEGAGATTLVYMLKKYLGEKDYVVALEVGKNDFGFFNEKDMYSVNEHNLSAAIDKFGTSTITLVDLNKADGSICDQVIYLMEPSIIKLNKMMLLDKNILDTLYEKNVVLNKSLLSNSDVTDFEMESHIKILYNLPPLNDRKIDEDVLKKFMKKINGTY